MYSWGTYRLQRQFPWFKGSSWQLEGKGFKHIPKWATKSCYSNYTKAFLVAGHQTTCCMRACPKVSCLLSTWPAARAWQRGLGAHRVVGSPCTAGCPRHRGAPSVPQSEPIPAALAGRIPAVPLGWSVSCALSACLWSIALPTRPQRGQRLGNTNFCRGEGG